MFEVSELKGVLDPVDLEFLQLEFQERPGIIRCPFYGPDVCTLFRSDLLAYNRRQMQQRLQTCGLGSTYWSAKLTEVEPKVRPAVEAYLKLIEAHKTPKFGLLITGPVGTGKTMILGLVAKALARAGRISFRFTSFSALYERMFRHEDLVTYKTVGVLLLDDLGRAYESPFALAQLEDIICERYDWQRPTCITTNLSKQQLAELGNDPGWARIIDRLRQRMKLIVLSGKSRRRAPKKEG